MNAQLDDLVLELRAAGEITRLRVLDLLAEGELSVGELAQVLGQSQPRLSRHLKLLNSANLIERMPEGAWVFYRLPVSGRVRALVEVLIASIDPADPVRIRDHQRLEEIKAARTSAAQLYFSRVAEQWDRLRAMHYSETDIETAVLEAAGQGPFEFVVDFGTGTGRMLALFAGRAERVEGIDLSHQMLTVARANLKSAAAANAAVRQGDVAAAPYDDACADLVIIHQVLHYLDDPTRALGEAARILRPGGRVIIVDFGPHQLEILRDEHAHRHLGVSDKNLSDWTKSAGLAVQSKTTFAPPVEGEGVPVNLWVAATAGEAPSRQASSRAAE